MAEIGSVKVGGGIAFWKPAEGTEQHKLEANLLARGLGDFAPPKRTDASALRGALEHEFHGVKNILIRGMQKPDVGFTVANERKGTAHDEWSGEQFLSCHLRANGHAPSLEFRGAENTQAERLMGIFRSLHDTLPASAITAMLVKIIDSVGGIALRESGGFYWIEERAFRVWEYAMQAVEAAGPYKVYLMKCLADMEMARAVTDSLIEEMDATCRRIERDIEAGTLGEEALTNRTKEALAAKERLSHFEGLFGTALEGVRTDLERVTVAAASCCLQAAAVARGL